MSVRCQLSPGATGIPAAAGSSRGRGGGRWGWGRAPRRGGAGGGRGVGDGAQRLQDGRRRVLWAWQIEDDPLCPRLVCRGKCLPRPPGLLQACDSDVEPAVSKLGGPQQPGETRGLGRNGTKLLSTALGPCCLTVFIAHT